MKFLKFLVVVLTIFASLVFTYGYLSEKEVISSIKNFYDRTPTTLINNEYRKDIDEAFVKITDNFIPKNKDELLDVYYTIMSSGMNEFTFYCDQNYTDCIKDVISINNDAELLSEINNYVHVYNSFRSIKTTYTTNGRITLTINRVYNDDDIKIINEKLDEIENKVIDEKKNDYNNILAIHDYIINNTKYSIEDENSYSFNDASTAKGVFFNNTATCNGYTDATALLLDRMNIKNIRITGNNHIWNLVYLNNKWLHLDLTWDDPVNNLNKDILEHTYFLKENIDEKHDYNKDYYKFLQK